MGKCWVYGSERGHVKQALIRRPPNRCRLRSQEGAKVSNRESRWVRMSPLHPILEAEASPTRAGGGWGTEMTASAEGETKKEKLSPQKKGKEY